MVGGESEGLGVEAVFAVSPKARGGTARKAGSIVGRARGRRRALTGGEAADDARPCNGAVNDGNDLAKLALKDTNRARARVGVGVGAQGRGM